MADRGHEETTVGTDVALRAERTDVALLTDLDYTSHLPELCQKWLAAYVETRYVSHASKMVGVGRNSARTWSGDVAGAAHKEVPGFRDAYAIALQEVRDQEFDRLGEDNELGIKEVMYGPEGDLKYTRYRQSEQLRKMRLVSLDPDRYATEKHSGTNINIVIVQKKEGW